MTASMQASPPKRGLAQSSTTQLVFTVLQYLGLMLFNALGLILIYGFIADDNLALALVMAVIIIGLDIIFFVPALYPLRWMAPGLALVTLWVVYPILITVSTAFTNYNYLHLLTKTQVVGLLGKQYYVPEDATVYGWDAYRNESGEYALWLSRTSEGGAAEAVFARIGVALEPVDSPPAEPPASYEGFTLLDRRGRTEAIGALEGKVFGIGDDTAQIKSRNEVARPLDRRFTYDAATDTITDHQTNTVYIADNKAGNFVPQSGNGEALAPGYRVGVGFDNFARLTTDPGLRGPLVNIFTWTVVFSLMSVLTTFAMGLFMALILNDPMIWGRKVFRSLLIIPYALPGVISVMVWRGMLDQNLGIIGRGLNNLLGTQIAWLDDPNWSKIMILLVNLWLGYPYMMLVCSGSLQAIPSDIYEAAAVDGAKPMQRFWQITLPLLLVAVGPLLIASFVYNFNNYLLIELLTGGDPQIPGTPTPAGYTDILISYTYSLAFGSNRGADYGYASAITIIIFLIVATVTLFQYRFTKRWEEVGENV